MRFIWISSVKAMIEKWETSNITLMGEWLKIWSWVLPRFDFAFDSLSYQGLIMFCDKLAQMYKLLFYFGADLILYDWSIVNLFMVILCLEVKELHSLYIYIYILCVFKKIKKKFFYTKLYGFEIFPSNTNNCIVLSNYFYLIMVICLHTVVFK